MKAPTDILNDIRRRLNRTWAGDLTGATTSWPHQFPLGATTKTELEAGWRTTYQPLIRQWRDWARAHPVLLHTQPKRVYTTTQDIPTHVEVADLDAAATLAGGGEITQLTRARERLQLVGSRFPQVLDLARLIRATDDYLDVDFALLLTAAAWFRTNDAAGYTPRQVPVPGVHAKWLNTHQPHILMLTGRDSLDLLPRHPARIHFTYLDPTYLATGARHHDSATVGDTFTPPYDPTVILISENKDTAIHFPPIKGGIAVEGAGFGGRTAAAFPWLTSVPNLYYWGDIDAHGYEILNGWREDGLNVTSILMDSTTYDIYASYGTNTDQNGNPLKLGKPKLLPQLTPDEQEVYNRLADPAFPGHRRIEQERIPLQVAVDTLKSRIS
ncbi:Wadjet anti-phage system protein JetD domain-containing protein [Actinophytocola sp.]|uniref:Wadjet anti-phage system protein JetD domain-containing protein n=1 Tax=Actinophytocola sp. TaxID=1872138 RepID=UPI003D6AB648